MKTIKKEQFETIIYSDLAKSKPFQLDGKDQTVKDLIKQYIDVPGKEPMTRAKSIALDRIFLLLNKQEDLSIEDNDFNILKKHIEDLGITHKGVFDAIFDTLDKAS